MDGHIDSLWHRAPTKGTDPAFLFPSLSFLFLSLLTLSFFVLHALLSLSLSLTLSLAPDLQCYE